MLVQFGALYFANDLLNNRHFQSEPASGIEFGSMIKKKIKNILKTCKGLIMNQFFEVADNENNYNIEAVVTHIGEVIKVIGVGGGGCNAVDNMVKAG